MDPFSITVGIAGLLSLVAKTLSLTNDYVSRVKNAKDSVATLVTELETLRSNLSSLDTLLRSDTAGTHGLAFPQTSVLRSCTSACESKLKTLCKRLGEMGDGKSSRFLWPLRQKEQEKTVQELRAFSQWLQFSLSLDGCSLMSRTSEDVLGILKQQLESFEATKSLQDQTTVLQETIAGQTRLLENARDTKRKRDILDWISKLDHEQKHYSIRSARVEGTGGWLLERPEYIRWRDDLNGSNILWCHGIQGSGKTVLTSMVIDDFKQSTEMDYSRVPIAFFYFDYREQDRQTPMSFLSSILRQIVEKITDIPSCVGDRYDKAGGSGGSLPLHELEKMILDIASSISQAYLIVDALDECDELVHRRPILQLLARLGQIPKLRLFITSRQYPQDIQTVFQTCPQVAVHAHEEDLRHYMHQQLDGTDVVHHSFASKLVDTLVEKAKGMFLLPILQLRTVLKEPTEGEMEDALESLSHTLPGAFQETIARIHKLPDGRKRLGLTSLLWICHAKRTLTAYELSEALSIRVGQKCTNPKYCPSPKMIVECCQGLVSLDSETLNIQLAHYAIQEYLIGQREKLFPRASSTLAFTCITYLLFDNFKHRPYVEKYDVLFQGPSGDENPFLSYSSRYWGVHVKDAETDPRVQQLAILFLGNSRAVAGAHQMTQVQKRRREEYWTPEECFSVTSLHHASYFGLEKIVLKLLDEGKFLVNARTKMGTTPLIKAACASPSGHPSVVQLLLQKGANPYLGNWYGNALHCAAEAGCSTTIRQLIEYGMDPNDFQNYTRPPLFCTLDNDHAGAFETLVDLGAHLKHEDFSALSDAVKYDCLDVVDLILRRRWAEVDAWDNEGFTAMHRAAEGGNKEIISRLLEAGAYVNVRDVQGRTPLDYLHADLDKDLVNFLVGRGAMHSVRGGSKKTCLG